ncbi:clasp N terminal-domain-containing protein [Bombardia bombarda]|uniref:Clasp N terminal-domain-containing protein n=1 Tax=Bombardia bombarda TaxID=252184 RepID=A0AA39X9N2_9PEZI|nr:clasp N terminal-domain-containing protein [Bombardia bombarda]
MADRISENQVADLLAILRNDGPIDAKVNQVTAVKSGIKQHNVPDPCVAPLFEALRVASTSQHAMLVNAGFTSLNHLLARMSRQDPKYLAKEAPRTLPVVVEKLGDQKEKFRSLALQAMATLYKAAPVDVERSVRSTAMVGKNSRAKEASLQWLLQMHQENGLQFRSYVPTLMELLEDADGMVRDAAKHTVIELFRTAPNAAKSDLKRQLKTFKVRPAIEQAIVKELAPTSSASSSQLDVQDDAPVPTRSNLAASVSSLPTERPITPAPDNRPEKVDPMYVNTQRELDDIFRDMQIHFEGKETEQNWLKREESVTKLRKLLAGNGASDFYEAYLNGVRGLLDGILKAVNSLRTSLSKEGCNLVQELARIYGPGIDPMVELLMQAFIKLCAATKKIASQQANITVDIIIGKVTYNARIMQHIWAACQDKNVQPRLYTAGWLKTLFIKESHHKSHVEHSGGLDLIEKCLKRGLADANPGVREQMRATYWTFSGMWPARAEAIMNSLDAPAQKSLQNDPHNPNSAPRRTEGGGPRPGLGLSKSTMGSSKPSLRETLLAQKKAMASASASASASTKNLPARPGSAMSHFSPVPTRTVSGSSHTSTVSTATTTTTTAPTVVRPRLEATHGSASGGISGAPMRPTKRRPEMVARPATAGPYSVRGHEQASVEQHSPPEPLRSKAATPKNITASPKRTAPKTRPGHAPTASEPNIITTPSRFATAKSAVSTPPRTTPSKQRQTPSFSASSPSKAHEELTLVVPTMPNHRSPSPQPVLPRLMSPQAAIVELQPALMEVIQPLPLAPIEPALVTPDTPEQPPLKVYEDPFVAADQTTPKSTFSLPVLEDKPVNEDAANIQQRSESDNGGIDGPVFSPEKSKQNSRLLESGISKVKQMSLDVHGFRKLQSIIRDNKVVFSDDKFDALLTGLFGYLESPLAQLAPEKIQDVRAQILATIKLLLKRMRDSFRPHVSRGLESLLRARAAYDGRTHIVSGLELLADELVTLGDATEMTLVLSRMLGAMDMDAPGFTRSLSMGLHVLKEMVEAQSGFVPSEKELDVLAGLAGRCLESLESAVRMDAVQLSVVLHSRVGDGRFWEALRGVRDDPKSLITYYIVKRQREGQVVGS